jgi:hypothetical protein
MKQITKIGILFCLLATTSIHAQTFEWAKSFGGTSIDVSNSITVDASGNVYSTGYFRNTVDFDPGVGVFNLTAGFYDIFVQKLDGSGNFLWAKSFGNTSENQGQSISLDASGNVYTTGFFQGTVDFNPGVGVSNLTATGSWDIFVQKLDTSGNFLWAKSFGSTNFDRGFSITVDDTGNAYTIGYFQGTGDFDPGAGVSNLSSVGSADVFLQKLDASGNFLWAKSFGGTDFDAGNYITVDASGNVYSTGYFRNTVDFDPGAGVSNHSSVGILDVFVQKLDPSGNFLWAKSFGGTGVDVGQSISVDASGNVYINGYFSGTVDFDPGPGVSNLTSAGSDDVFVQKMDASGNFLWAKSFGGTSGDIGNSIRIDSLGNIYTTGYFNGTVDFDPGAGVSNLTSAGGSDVFVQKLDGSGNFLWAKSFGGTSNESGKSISVDASGNVYTNGELQGTGDFDPGAGVFNLSSTGQIDVFVLKMSQCIATAATDTIVACNSYIWIDGNTYTTSNNAATHTLTNQAGCDSVVTLNLTINNFNTGTDVQTACDSYIWIDGNTYATSNNSATFNIVGGASNGCDSLVTLDLTIINSSSGTDTRTECDSYTWIDGNTYTSNNNSATFNIVGGAVNGCDSLVTLDLTIGNSASGTDTRTECNSYTWIDGNTYTSNNNTATFNIVSGAANACDSLVTLDLTIINSAAGTDTRTECDSLTWIDGNTYTANNNSATFNIVGGAANGCDSLVTIDLTIINSSAGTDTRTECDSLTWIDGNTYYTNNNTATFNITGGAANMCDSLVALDLTITSVSDITTTTSGTTISANNTGATYQWLDCDANYSIIVGEAGQSFSATSNGNFAVELTENSCLDTSACIAITTVGIVESDFGGKLVVYPNPTNGNFSVDLGSIYKSSEIRITDMNGKLIYSKLITESQILNLSLEEPAGIYFISIQSDDKKAILRLIKK